MKAKLLILFALIILLVPLTVNAENTSPLENLDQISDDALQMVKLQRYEDAKKILDYFSDQFLSVTTKETIFTMDELRIITVAHNQAVEAITSVEMAHEQRTYQVTKFRLVIDAIHSNYQPLWTEMEEPIMSVFAEMKTAAYKGVKEDFDKSLDNFLSLYEVIHPSMKVDIPVEKIQRIDARVNFIDHYRPEVLEHVSSQEELAALEADLKTIFDEMTEDEADPSLWWVIISTGSIIILTLSYVGWRKYEGDRNRAKNRQKQLKD